MQAMEQISINEHVWVYVLFHLFRSDEFDKKKIKSILNHPVEGYELLYPTHSNSLWNTRISANASGRLNKSLGLTRETKSQHRTKAGADDFINVVTGKVNKSQWVSPSPMTKKPI